MRACFIASVRSGPCGIALAFSRAISASASRSSLGRGFLIGRAMDEVLLGRCWIIRLLSGIYSIAGFPQMRRPRLAGDPDHGVRFKGIAVLNPGFEGGAFRTSVDAIFETRRSGRDVSRHHPPVAVVAARTVDRQ